MKPLIQDKGLEEYDGVKTAYEELEKITERAADLKAYIEGHQAGAEWLRLENEAKFDAVQGKAGALLSERSKRFRRSLNILDSIETRIGKVGDLYRPYEEETSTPVISNACMAIAYHLAGRKDIAQKVLNAIETEIGKEGILYRAGIKIADIGTISNAYMAVALSATGKKDNAGKILQKIEANIGKNGELYYDSSDKKLYSETNAVMALAFLLQGNEDNAERILEGIDSRIGVDKNGMYHYLPYSQDYSLPASPIVSAIHFLLGRKRKAEETLGNFKEYISVNKRQSGELVIYSYNDRMNLDTRINALMAIVYALQEGAKMCGLPRER